MQESATSFHQLEWPAAEARVAGPVVWVQGWVTGRPGVNFVDIRVTGVTGLHHGILGGPRRDLAAHFKSPRPWLPAEFAVGVPLPDGPAELSVEAMDEYGNWHRLQSLAITVAPDGATPPRTEGEVISKPGGSVTSREPHLPFHGHLDQLTASRRTTAGRIEVFGWLLHETQAVRTVFATLDGLVFNALEAGLTDDALATELAQHTTAGHARFRGGIDAPPTLTYPASLRVYAELTDGSVHLCFARRIEPVSEENSAAGNSASAHAPAAPLKENSPGVRGAPLPAFASGRPRRLLLVVRSLQPDDATLRALDVARQLLASGRWALRLVASEDGPLHADFEASECAVQLVDPRAYFAASEPAQVEIARRQLSREIWWRHLDGVAQFDPASTWANQSAAEQGIPVFADPIDSLRWFSPSPLFSFDAAASLVAPVRGQAAHGAGVLRHAADQLARHPAPAGVARAILVTDVRNTVEEQLFKASLALQPTTGLVIAARPQALAALICPVFTGHPQRTLLSALAAGVPLITTPSAWLTATFGANEVSYVPAGNPLALAHAITDTLANPGASGRRAAAAARLVLAEHNPSDQLPRWQALLEAAIGG